MRKTLQGTRYKFFYIVFLTTQLFNQLRPVSEFQFPSGNKQFPFANSGMDFLDPFTSS